MLIYAFLCCRHYAVPHIPPIDGIEEFKGMTTHSHNYRDPECFRDKTVAVLGASSSGMDIAMEVSLAAKKVNSTGTAYHRQNTSDFWNRNELFLI